MFRRWCAVLLLVMLAGPKPSVAQLLDVDAARADIVRALIPPKVRDAIRERRIFEFPDPGATRSRSGARLYEQAVSRVVLVGTADGEIGGGGFIAQEGFVVTTSHAVGRARQVGIWLRTNTPSIRDVTDKNMIVGQVVALDRPRDLALVRLFEDRSPRVNAWLGIKPLPLADLSQVKVGQDVFAIGHPEAYLWSYTEGVVSAIRPGHAWEYKEGDSHQVTVIQTQAPISPGSSGALLFDMTGRVIGITGAAAPGTQGLNFAIAANEIQDFIAQHAGSQHVKRVKQ